jgi:hypothetical protein
VRKKREKKLEIAPNDRKRREMAKVLTLRTLFVLCSEIPLKSARVMSIVVTLS